MSFTWNNSIVGQKITPALLLEMQSNLDYVDNNIIPGCTGHNITHNGADNEPEGTNSYTIDNAATGGENAYTTSSATNSYTVSNAYTNNSTCSATAGTNTYTASNAATNGVHDSNNYNNVDGVAGTNSYTYSYAHGNYGCPTI